MRRRKVRRAKGPVIPLTSRGQPPSYFELLQEAVLTLKEAGTGASLPEIRRQLQRRYKGRFNKAGDKLLTTALQRLAERGKVICKRGYRYQFNAPKVSKPKPTKSASSCSGASSAPSDANNDSRTSASSDSSTSGTNRSGKSSAKDGEGVPKDGGEGSGEDSASSTASRRASSKKTLSNLPSSRKCTSRRCNFSKN